MIALARRHAGPWPLLLLSALAAGLLFAPGITAVLAAWGTPEYSHGPLIPVISAWLFAREVQRVPAREAGGMGPGLVVLALAVLCGVVGHLAGVGDVSAYGLILWVFAMVLLALGGHRGMAHWASVAHLVFMLPLPQVVWWEANLFLQGVSAELGVWLIGALGVPVFLEGHIIDLGVWRLEVAEACSGLRYMFPILSFSVITAVMFNGPIWAKTVLVLSAAPIAIVLNAARIGVIGVLVDAYGIEMAEGALHVMQGWVIFGGCLALLFLLSRVLWRVTGDSGPMLDLAGVDVPRAVRELGQWQPRDSGWVGAVATACIALMLVALPSVQSQAPERLPFAALPTQIGDWRGQATALAPEIEAVLGADDYLDMALVGPGQAAPVNLFAAWYGDQTGGAGLHSPEVCLPAGGWEIAELERVAIAPEGMGPFDVNRAVIVKDGERRLVFYWFEQRGRRMTSAIGAKLTVLADGVVSGRKDGALVRVMTPIANGESEAEAQARLIAVLEAAGPRLPQYIPGA